MGRARVASREPGAAPRTPTHRPPLPAQADAPKPPAAEVAALDALKAEQARRLARYLELMKAEAEQEGTRRARARALPCCVLTVLLVACVARSGVCVLCAACCVYRLQACVRSPQRRPGRCAADLGALPLCRRPFDKTALPRRPAPAPTERERARAAPQVAHTPSGAVVTVDDFLVDFATYFRWAGLARIKSGRVARVKRSSSGRPPNPNTTQTPTPTPTPTQPQTPTPPRARREASQPSPTPTPAPTPTPTPARPNPSQAKTRRPPPARREASQLDADRHVDHVNLGWDATTRAMQPATADADALFGSAEEHFREVTGLGLLNWCARGRGPSLGVSGLAAGPPLL